MAAVAGSGDGAEIVPSSWRGRKFIAGCLLFQDERSVKRSHRTVQDHRFKTPDTVSVAPLRQMEESQPKSRASCKPSLSSFTKVAHIGESTTVMEYVLLFIARPAETSSRQSHRADLLTAGRINNSLFGALARAEGTVCCGVQIVVKIMRLSKVCLKLKDGNNCTNPAHYTANTADDSSRRGRDGEESRPLTDIFSLSFCSRLGCSSVYLMDPV